MRWAILGGGLTGVTLGRLLHEKGEEVVILEKERSVGGLCRSKKDSGFTFDIGGSHIIFSRDQEVLAFMNQVLGTNRGERRRNTKIFHKGRYVKYPFENGLAELPKEDCFFCINEFINNLIAVEKGEIPLPRNFREWIYHTFGRGIAELYMVPYNEKIWNYPTEKMSHHWVDGRIPRPPVEDIIRSAIGIETEGYTHQLVFSYPVKGGIEALIHAIAAPVVDMIKTGFRVSSIRGENDDFRISDGKTEIFADRCISTIPIHELLPSLYDVPESVMTACNNLRYNSLACVYLGVEGRVPDYSWVYIPEEYIGTFNRISFPSNYSTDVAPAGCSSVLAEITFNEGDMAADMSDAEIVEHVTEGLEKMGVLSSPGDVIFAQVERQKYAYVVYDLPYTDNIRAVRDFCAARDISLVGRFAEFEYLNMDGCIRRAIDFVGRLA